MSHTLIDLFNNILKYNDNDIIVVLDDNADPWFSAIQIAKLLGYVNTQKAVRNNVPIQYRTELDQLVDYPSDINPNAQPHSVFINEPGLYALVSHSNKKEAEDFRSWLYETVIPTIRKTGKFIMAEKYKIELEKIKEKLKQYKEKNKILLHNQKKEKYPEGGFIYVMRPVNVEKDLKKVGKSCKLSPRINTYNTTVPDKINVLYSVKVTNPNAVELCIKSVLYKYRYKTNKEYYKCSLKKIVDAIENCQYFVEGECFCNKCKKKIRDVSRHISEEFDLDEDNDEEIFELLYEVENDNEDDDNNDDNLEGGSISNNISENYEQKYLKYKAKFIEMQLKNLLIK